MDATRTQLSPSPYALRMFLKLWKLIKSNMRYLGVRFWRLLQITIIGLMNPISGNLSHPWSDGNDSQPIQLHFNTSDYTAQTVPPPLLPLTIDNELEVASAKSTTSTSYSPALCPVVRHDSSPYNVDTREDVNHLTLDDSTGTVDRVIQDDPEIASPSEDLSKICFCLFPEYIASRKTRTFVVDNGTRSSIRLGRGKTVQLTYKTPNLPLGWTRHVNPEGSPFFYHKDKNVITEAWIYESEQLELVEKFINFMLKERDAFERQEDVAQFTNLILKDEKVLYGPGDAPDLSHTQLFIELKKIPNHPTECHYYFADDRTSNIFWLEDLGFPLDPILDAVVGKLEPEHIKLAIERQYWLHCEHFPNVQKAPLHLWKELWIDLECAFIDRITSKTSTTAYSCEQLKDMISTVSRISKDMSSPSEIVDYSRLPWVLGRCKVILLHERFLNFYGQRGARLNWSDSVYDPGASRVGSKPSLPFRLSSLLFFWGGPCLQIQEFEKMWVDEIIRIDGWKYLMKKLKSSWAQHGSLGTILIAANASFLAIPSIDGSPTPVYGNKFGKMFSYVSIHTGLARTATEAQSFLRARQGRNGSLESLATLYSIPYATFIWSTLAFLAAFAAILPTADTSTRVVLGVSGVISIGLISWCVVVPIRPKPARNFMKFVSIFDGSRTSLWMTRRALFPKFRISDPEEGNESEKMDEA